MNRAAKRIVLRKESLFDTEKQRADQCQAGPNTVRSETTAPIFFHRCGLGWSIIFWGCRGVPVKMLIEYNPIFSFCDTDKTLFATQFFRA